MTGQEAIRKIRPVMELGVKKTKCPRKRKSGEEFSRWDRPEKAKRRLDGDGDINRTGGGIDKNRRMDGDVS